MNIRFKEIDIENFRSIDKAYIVFENQGTVIVKGINEYENKSLKSEQYLEGKSIMDDESSNTEKNLIQKFKDMIKRK